MNRLHYCYLLTRSLPEGGCRYYVGIRTCPVGKTPETDNYWGSGDAIEAAVDLYGRDAFRRHIVETFDTIDEAKALERALVGLTTANSPWSYNLREGGGSGGLLSEATKAKLSARALEQYAAPAGLEKARAAALKRYQDPAECAKSSARATKRLADPAAREAHRASCRTPQARENNRASRLKRLADPAKLEAHRASCRTPQARENNRVGQLKRYENETPDRKAARRRAISEGRRRARAERARVQREVGLIFLALVAAKYAA